MSIEIHEENKAVEKACFLYQALCQIKSASQLSKSPTK